MSASDQEHYWLAAVLVADVKVTQAAEVVEGDATVGVEAVSANAVVELGLSQGRRGFKASMESLQRGAAIKSSVWSLLFVDGAKGIKLQLQVGKGVSRRLFGQEELQGLVEAFHLAAGLGGDRAWSERTQLRGGRARTRGRRDRAGT